MDYSGVKSAALAYTDRATDAELTAAMLLNFTKVIESRANRALDTQRQSSSNTIPIVISQVYYALPTNLNALKNVVITDSNGDSPKVAGYIAPELIDSVLESSEGIVYTIQDGNIRFAPVQDAAGFITFYMGIDLSPLVNDADTNWLSTYYPDVYVFGLAAEISMFAKDYDAASAWNTRFKEALLEIQDSDTRRWITSAPTIQLG